MTRKSRIDTSREGGRFIALPHVVMESDAYLQLSHPARALLLEFALQYHGDDNGRLLCSGRHLKKRGWNSNDQITRAKRELLEKGFIHETVKGHRPNKASWYAITWQTLDKIAGIDPEAAKTFRRGAYRIIDAITPLKGVKALTIAPPYGLKTNSPRPPDGTIRSKTRFSSTPYKGDPLEEPSVVNKCQS